jgi:hypothetical protein
MNRLKSMRGRASLIFLSVAATMAMLLALAPAAYANAVTVKKSGHTGYLVRQGLVTCGNTFTYGPQITAPTSIVTMAPRYPAYQQTVKAIQRLQWWVPRTPTTAGHWEVAAWSTWSTGEKADTNRYVFYNKTWNVADRHYYRVATIYRWYRYGVEIGTVTNMFDVASWWVDTDQAVRSPILYNFGANVPTYCWEPAAGIG